MAIIEHWEPEPQRGVGEPAEPGYAHNWDTGLRRKLGSNTITRKTLHGVYDATTSVIEGAICHECELRAERLMQFVAEENAGEFYAVALCLSCLRLACDTLAEHKP